MNYILYGKKSSPSEIVHFLQHNISVNEKLEASGKRKRPICIWGKHGIGKTELVEAFAKSNGFQLAYIAPAQFEEMGDLLGMPVVKEDQTHFAAPDWVPQNEGPGILLIDDVNRADDRILRGIMQLLQHFKMVSWQLPPRWQIVLTANPDGGDYSVTPMDEALITRMLHITMEFNLNDWVQWATTNNIDQRGIDFVRSYPDILTEKRTTPRTLVQFFETVFSIKNTTDFGFLKKEKQFIHVLGAASLDTTTVAAFLNFLENDFVKIPSPEQILTSKNFKNEIYFPLKKMIVQENSTRVDLLLTISTRLEKYLQKKHLSSSSVQISNLKSFLKMDFMPNDFRLALAQRLVSQNNPTLKSIFSDPEISALLLG